MRKGPAMAPPCSRRALSDSVSLIQKKTGGIEVLKRANVSESEIDRSILFIETLTKWNCWEWVENIWIGGK